MSRRTGCRINRTGLLLSAFPKCLRLLLVLAAAGCWAQSQSAQVVDDRLQPPGGPAVRTSSDLAREGKGEHGHKNKRHKGTAHPPAALVEQPKVEPPPPPPTPAQQPPNLPQVSYRNGLLTVTANNATLGDIMDMVRKKTGADIDYPATLSQERVAAVVGPAPTPQVLATLLNGTRYDYILLGMNGRPDLLQRAIITPREASGAVASAAGPPPMNRAAPPPPAGDEESEMAPEEPVEQPEEVPPQQAQPGQPQPGIQAVPNQQVPPGAMQQPFPGQQPAQGAPGQPQQPKTPEQLLQELQRMQQQQMQQQQQQQQQPQ